LVVMDTHVEYDLYQQDHCLNRTESLAGMRWQFGYN